MPLAVITWALLAVAGSVPILAAVLIFIGAH